MWHLLWEWKKWPKLRPTFLRVHTFDNGLCYVFEILINKFYCAAVCGPGTYSDGSGCLACPYGQYQPFSGRTFCYECPFTTQSTEFNEAVSENECYFAYDSEDGKTNVLIWLRHSFQKSLFTTIPIRMSFNVKHLYVVCLFHPAAYNTRMHACV